MIFLKWCCFAVVDLLIMLVGLVTAPLVAGEVDKSWNIPDPVVKETCQTPDSLMNGYGGDRVFYEKWSAIYKKYSVTWIGERFFRWWIATRWQWRNTTQGYSTWVLGLDEPRLLMTRSTSRTGYTVKALDPYTGKTVGFEWKLELKWFFANKRFVLRMGWKFGWDYRFPAQFVFSIRPWQSI